MEAADPERADGILLFDAERGKQDVGGGLSRALQTASEPTARVIATFIPPFAVSMHRGVSRLYVNLHLCVWPCLLACSGGHLEH